MTKERKKQFKKEILSIKGGDFIQWHEGLSPIESFLYKIIFKELQLNTKDNG